MVDGSPDQSVRSLVRLVLLFRLIALNVTVFELAGNPGQVPGVMVGLVLAAFASFLPLRYWDQWGGPISTRPVFLGVDLMLNLTIYAYLGPASPFFLYTLGTPLLAGLLFRTTGAVVLGGGMLVGYYVMVVLSGNGLDELRTHEARDIQALVVLPALYPLAAAGGAAVRALLDRQATTQVALASAERRAAAGAERARVAREMHDSLGKTLYGIALAARGPLAPRRSRGAGRRRRGARPLGGRAGGGRGGAGPDLRPALGHARPAPGRRAGAATCASGRTATGSPPTCRPTASTCRIRARATSCSASCARRWRTSSAMRARRRCEVLLRDVAPDVVLCVVDDGVGIDGDGDARSLQTNGHYGLIGMAERGERIGATVRGRRAVPAPGRR